MENSEVYVTVGLDKKGNVVEVRLRGKDPIKPRGGKPGLLRDGAVAPGCEKVARYLVHELLVCQKKGHPGGTGEEGSGSDTDYDPGSDSDSGNGGSGSGSDPCCYRDPFTGRIWCWC